MKQIIVHIHGQPAPGGSKRGFYVAKLKRVVITDDAGEKNRDWKSCCRVFARETYTGDPLTGPLEVLVTFYLVRPAGHFGSGRNEGMVKAGAPRYPAKKPDLTKFWRATEDALTGLLWVDDAQIVRQECSKVYGKTPGAMVVVREVEACRPVRELDTAAMAAGAKQE